MATKWLLVTPCYTHRSVSCSGVIRKPPPTVDGNKFRHPYLDNMRKTGIISPRWDVSITSHPSRLREPCRRGRAVLRASRDWECLGNKASKPRRTYVHMNSQGLGHYARGLRRSRSDGLSVQRVEVQTNPHPLPTNYLQVTTTGKWKTSLL